MKGIIYGSTSEKAYDKLRQICQKYMDKNIHIQIQTKDSVTFWNGDCWHATRICDNARGYRANKILVDINISKHTINELIIPALPSNGTYEYFS